MALSLPEVDSQKLSEFAPECSSTRQSEVQNPSAVDDEVEKAAIRRQMPKALQSVGQAEEQVKTQLASPKRAHGPCI